MIKIYIGLDNSQLLPAKVLEYSIIKNTNEIIQIKHLNNLKIPVPKDKKNKPKTGFSFGRFCIPQLNGFSKRAIYLDADMIVFDDIVKLWNVNLKNKSLLLKRIDFKTNNKNEDSRIGKKQISVMLLDCSKLDWKIEKIVEDLDKDIFSYDELMQDLILEKEENILTNLPITWNSLDYFDQNTSLLHFTNLKTQPWVNSKNNNKYIWNSLLREMINKNIITIDEIFENINLGFVRPSLILEIKYPFLEKKIFNKLLNIYDNVKKFIPHYKKTGINVDSYK